MADRLTRRQTTIRLMNGATNTPGFASLKAAEAETLLDFLETRSTAGPPTFD